MGDTQLRLTPTAPNRNGDPSNQTQRLVSDVCVFVRYPFVRLPLPSIFRLCDHRCNIWNWIIICTAALMKQNKICISVQTLSVPVLLGTGIERSIIIFRGTPFYASIHDAKAAQFELRAITRTVHRHSFSGANGDKGYDARFLQA